MMTAIRYGLCVWLLFWGALLQAAPDFPALTGRIIDKAQLLNASDSASLTDALAQLETDTSAQVVVATVPNLQGYAIEEYGLLLGRHWGIGQKNKNNGAIVLVARDDKKIRIEVGYGLEGTLPDAYVAYIIHSILRPAFRQGDFSGGISRGVNKIIGKIKQDPSAEMPDNFETGDGDFPVIFLIPFFAVAQSFIKKTLPGILAYSGIPLSIGVAWWLSQDVVLSLIVGVFVFLLTNHFHNGGGSGGSSGGNSGEVRRRSDGGFGGGFSGGFGGGGFSGGGGGFGGGGASGGW